MDGKGPEVFLGLLWPVKDKIEKRGSGPIEDSFNVTFRVVLVMGTNPGNTPKLLLIVTASNSFLGSEGMVVRGIVLGFDAVITQKGLKRMLPPQKFG